MDRRKAEFSKPITMFAALAVVMCLAVLSLAAPALAVTPDDSLAGVSPVTPAQLEAELSSRNPNHVVPDIARLYVEWGYRFGIRADLAFAQMLHETNFLRFGGYNGAEAWQNNFAGIGVTGGSHGNAFATPELGVIGQYAHLAWYTFPNHVNPLCSSAYDPRHFGTGHANTGHTLRELQGRWAVPGTGYGTAIANYANEIWRYPPGGYYLGSFNEAVGTPDTALSTTFYFPWYDSRTANGMGGNWIMVGNMGSGNANAQIWIGGQQMHDPANPGNDFFSIPEGGQIVPTFANVTSGPVVVVSTGGQRLMASQRVLYHDSFNEVSGTPVESLTDSYEFTWYDSLKEDGMTGNWVLVSNQGSVPAEVEIWIGAARVASYSAAGGNALAPGAIITPTFPGTMNGPVRVVSTNHQPLIASQRVLYKDSFSEVMGYPTGSLGTEYYFTWYDSLPQDNMTGDWVLVSNRGAQPADVNVYVAGHLTASFSAAGGNAIQPGQSVTPTFPGLVSGPVYVQCLNGQKLLASQRVLFRDSFEEVQGIAPAAITSDQWFSWYDSALYDYMRGNWVMVANRGGADARVEIYIGREKMHDPANPANDFFTVPVGGNVTPQFYNRVSGPVHVVSTNGQPLMVSQRVLYKEGLPR